MTIKRLKIGRSHSAWTSMNNGAQLSPAIVIAATLFVLVNLSSCDKQDAILLRPAQQAVKGIIDMVADGKPLNLEFSTGDLARSAGLLIFRAKFPVRMPSGVVQKTQDLLNRVRQRVDQTDVTLMTRKTMPQMGRDLNMIADAMVDEVGRSPDGIYTDYLQTQIRNLTLEEAFVDVGLQLKAWQMDLVNYRDIAAMLLGIPVIPQVASTINGAINLVPDPRVLKNITQYLVDNSKTPIYQVSNLAGIIRTGAGSVSNITSNIPIISSITG